MGFRTGSGVERWSKAGFALALVVLFAASAFLTAGASAQENKRPRTLLELLFRGDNRGGAEAKKPSVKVKNRNTTKKKSTATAKAAEPEAVVKLETAKTVMVVGDFFGSGLAEGLVAVFAQNAGVKVLDRTQGASGFVRSDLYDWPTEIKGLVEAERPVAVVVMLGSNDRQQMRVGDAREQAMSEKWVAEYTLRVNALAKAAADLRLPVIWVGLPAFKSTKMSQDVVALNDIYRQAAESVGGAYVDIWDGFVDENGAFVTSGPDINGQVVRLRGSDGINLSKAGKRKVAFYVEKPLTKFLGGETMPMLDPLGGIAPPSAALQQDISEIDRTQPVSLIDPELDGGAELLGYKVEKKKEKAISLGEKLSIEGVAPAASPGRADNFGGPPEPLPVVETAKPTEVVPPAAVVPPVEVEAAPPAEETVAGPETTTAIRR